MDKMNGARWREGRVGMAIQSLKRICGSIAVLLLTGTRGRASEADLAIPDLWHHGTFDNLGGITPGWLLFFGSFVILGTLGISLYQLYQIHKQPAHKSMLDISEIIFATCRTYLIQQGKFLLMLFAIIAVAMTYYFLVLKEQGIETVAYVLGFSVVGMAGSYAVAWYGIRVNTFANARTAFASLKGQPWHVANLPLPSAMPFGLFPTPP